MVSFNRVVLAGNLTRDPELRFTQSGVPVANFGLAVNRVRSKNEEVDFFDVTAWRELGETVTNWKKKGDPILVEGRLQYRTYEANDGSKRNKVDIVADNVQFLGSGTGKSDENGSSGNGGSGAGASRGSAGSRGGNEGGSGRRGGPEVDEETYDDIPFRALDVRRPVF
jgi:single-strand DNA-binding protein